MSKKRLEILKAQIRTAIANNSLLRPVVALIKLLVVALILFAVVLSIGLVVYRAGDLGRMFRVLGERTWSLVEMLFMGEPNHLYVLLGVSLLVSVLLFVLLLEGIRHWVFHRRIKSKQSKEDCLRDVPIESLADDALGRKDFVNQLKSVLQSESQERHALNIGLYGAWGEGKTSVMNLVQRELRDDPAFVFVDFSSWEHEKREDMPYLLFAQIARKVAKRLDPGLGWMLFRYAVMLVPHKFVSLAGPLEWVADLIVRVVNVSTSEERLKGKVEYRLRKLGAKIIVVLDDVDRLEAKDIQDVLRLIRTVGDIGGFVYCTLSSREHLLASIQKDEGESHEALQKFINLELDLPPVPRPALQKVFLARANAVLRGSGLPELSEEATCLKIFSCYVQNCRAVVRLVNELIVRIAFYQNKVESKRFPVNIDDLVAVSIIHLYDPDFWDRLYRGKELIFPSSLTNTKYEQTVEKNEFEITFGCRTDDKHAKIRLEFFKHYFGIKKVNHEDEEYYVLSVDVCAAEMAHRLKAPRCFNTYYEGIAPELNEVGFVERIKESLGDEEKISSYLKLQNKSGRLKDYLVYLERIPPVQDKEKRSTYLRALIRLGDEPLEPETSQGHDEVVQKYPTSLARCVTSMLCAVYAHDTTKGGAEFLEIIKGIDAIVILKEAVHRENGEWGVRFDVPFTDNDYSQIVDLFLDRIKKLQKEGRLIGYVDEVNLRSTWFILLKDGHLGDRANSEREIYRQLLQKDASKFPNVIHVMLPYRCYGENFPEIYAQRLNNDFNLGQIREVLDKCGNELSEEQRTIRDNIRYCLEQYEKKQEWPSPQDQERKFESDRKRNAK